LFVVTVLSSDGLELQDRFDATLDDLLRFKHWLKENGYYKMAVESTGNYRILIYNVLEESANFILENAYQIKHISGRKTDTLDSGWLAEVYLKNLISPSNLFQRQS